MLRSDLEFYLKLCNLLFLHSFYFHRVLYFPLLKSDKAVQKIRRGWLYMIHFGNTERSNQTRELKHRGSTDLKPQL